MVNQKKIKKSLSQEIDIPEVELSWSSIAVSEVQQKANRLEASVYDIIGKKAHEVISECKYPLKTLCGENGLADAYHCPRFKRIYVEHSEFPIFQPSQINDIYPKPHTWISELTPTDIEALRVKKGQILMTCSGTIANCTIVGDTLNNKIFSHDLIRITPKDKDYTGYIYAYLITKTGKTIVGTNNYGAVISHIEPNHLNNVLIPEPTPLIRDNINSLIIDSVNMLDKSNRKIDQAESLLIKALNLPSIKKFDLSYFDKGADLQNYQVPLSHLSNRLDASFHQPIVNEIIDHVKKNAKELIPIRNNRVSKKIFIPGRFKRVYVLEGQGIPFFSGKCITELDPSNKKYISKSVHAERIDNQLKIKKNMILITCSGTIGKTVLVPKHWDGWVMTHDIIRLIPESTEIAGYIFSWLNSEFGNILLNRYNYGAVVDHIEDFHVADLPIPMLKDKQVQSDVNTLILVANELRFQAYEKEQKAIKMVNELVIHATDKEISMAADPLDKGENILD